MVANRTYQLRRSWPVVLGSALTGLVIVALATSFIASPAATPHPTPASATIPGSTIVPEPTPTPRAAGTAAFIPPDEAWGAVALDPAPAAATLVPTSGGTEGVPPEAAFNLTSLTQEPATEVAARISLDPPVELKVESVSTSRALLRPLEPLAPGATYRVRLASPDGGVEASWAFPVVGPLRVVGTIPGHHAVGVPVNVGVELTFDREGALDVEKHFAIEPAVPGHFETHEASTVFVPEQPLEHATVYQVVVSPGVRVEGSVATLEEAVAFAFETAPRVPPPSTPVGRRVVPETRLIGIPSGGRAEVPLQLAGGSIVSVSVEVHRLPSLADLVGAMERLELRWWTDQTQGAWVDTASLERVAALPRRLEPLGEYRRVARLPPLDTGWYVVTIVQDGLDEQLLVQATDLAASTVVTTTETVVWVNDIATSRPASGAVISTLSGRELARTDEQGLARMSSATLVEASGASDEAPITGLQVRQGSASVFVPIRVRPGVAWSDYGGWWWDSAHPDYWMALSLDRSVFRSTDAIEVWGLLRPRIGVRAPERVELEIRAAAGDDAPRLVRQPVRRDDRGVFAESLTFNRLPAGSYTLELVADGTTIRQTWFEVGEIVKPAYTLEVDVNRHVLVAGEDVVATVTARFFDGTPVPGLPIWLSTQRQGDAEAQAGVTGADGTLTRSISVEAADYRIVARPRAAEEADIEGHAEIEVFGSSVDVHVRGIVDGSRVRFEGFVYRVDVEALERAWDRRWSEEWWTITGSPVASAVVSIAVAEQFWVAIPTGRRYDFISKQTVETFRWEHRSRTILERSVTTDREGQFEIDLPRTEREREYEAYVRTADGDGRPASGWGSASTWPSEHAARRPVTGTRSYLVGRSDDCGSPSSTLAAVGDVVPITMYDASGTAIDDGANRYLFATTARGLRDVSVTSSPTHEQPFQPGDLPNLFVDAVRFTGDAYVRAVGHRVGIDRDRHSLSVTLTAAAERYRPGDTVTVQVRTTTPEGTPVPASVVLRAVDEKLFASGLAWAHDVRWELLGGVDSGLQDITMSHQHPVADGSCEGGDTTGGGGDERFDFRDTALFEKIQTDSRGRASVSFTLPHDLTSWRVLATAIDEGFRVGDSRLLVPVGLPFFAEMTAAPSYLSSDRPAVRVRAYGSALEAGDPVRFEVSSDLPGHEPMVVIGTAFAPSDVALPAMPVGRHRITVRATSAVDGGTMTDALTRSIDVIPTRLTRRETVQWTVGSPVPDLSRADGLVDVLLHDVGRARLLPWLWEATPSSGLRLDSRVAADAARQLLIDRFGVDASQLPESLWRRADYDRGENGWALVPHGSPDLRLTTRVAIAAPDLVRGTTGYLRGLVDNTDERRDRRLRALAALAALGENVLPDVVAAAQATDLSTDERLLLALTAGLAGDDAIALGQLRLVLAGPGEQFGPWIRVRAADPDASLRSTALLATALASVGDQRALDALAYLEAVPSTRELFALEPVIVARLLVDRLPASTGRARWTIDGQWIEASGGAWLTLSPEQAADLRLEHLDGAMEAVARFQISDPVVSPSAGGRLERSSFANALPDDQLVTVTLSFTPPPPDAAERAYVITEQVPSGLAPMQLRSVDADALWYTTDGQTVRWWVDPREKRRLPLRYRARVVTTGSYAWEPAVARGFVSGRVIAATRESRVAIQSRT